MLHKKYLTAAVLWSKTAIFRDVQPNLRMLPHHWVSKAFMSHINTFFWFWSWGSKVMSQTRNVRSVFWGNLALQTLTAGNFWAPWENSKLFSSFERANVWNLFPFEAQWQGGIFMLHYTSLSIAVLLHNILWNVKSILHSTVAAIMSLSEIEIP